MKDEIELEVFRADTKASRGITAAAIADLATSYDPEAHPAAVCIGHPKSDTPSYGLVSKFRSAGSSLFATVKDLKDKVVDGIKGGELIAPSMAFFSPGHEANPTPGKLAPRHLAFLGASAPGIPGLNLKTLKSSLAFNAEDDSFDLVGAPAPAILFSADGEFDPTEVIIFAAPKEAPAMEPTALTAEQLAERERIIAERETNFAAREEETRKAGNTAAVARLITAGKVKPADKDAFEHVFNALGGDVIEFAADDKTTAASKLETLIMAGPNVVPVNRDRQSPTTQFQAKPEPTGDVQRDADAIAGRARALMKERPELSFEAAVEEIAEAAE